MYPSLHISTFFFIVQPYRKNSVDMSVDAETAVPRVESSAEELAKAAVEIQVSGLVLGNPVGFFVYEWRQFYCGFCMQVVLLRIIVVDLG